MDEVRKRRVHSAEFKAKVGIEAVRGVKRLNEIGQQYGVHLVVVRQWRKEITQGNENPSNLDANHGTPGDRQGVKGGSP